MTGGGEIETGMSSFPFWHSSSLWRVEGLLLGDVHEQNSMVEVLDPETTFEYDRTWRSRSDPSRLTLTRRMTAGRQPGLTKLERCKISARK